MLYSRKLSLILATLVAFLALSGCTNTSNNANTGVTDNRTPAEIWNDNNIEFEAAALSNKPPFNGKVRVAANSFRGKVVLIGQASTQELSQEIAQRVEKVKGVNKVYNQIRIQEMIGITQMSHDSWITTKVKSALFSNADLKGAKVKVITENGEVFLFGYVTAEHANIATETARNVAGVKHVIRGFEVAKLAKHQEKNQVDNKVTAPDTTSTQPASVEDAIVEESEPAVLSEGVMVESPLDTIEETSIN